MAAYERECGQALPADYRSFLLRHNGIAFRVPLAFPIVDAEDDEYGRLSVLFGLPSTRKELASALGRDESERDAPPQIDLRVGGELLDFNERVPPNIVAIGETISEERICLSMYGPDCGTVYIWQPPELFEKKNVPTTRYLRRLAPSFSAFWRSLYKDPKPLGEYE